VSQFAFERMSLMRFLRMNADDLRAILNELPSGRDRRRSPLDGDAIESLIRVMDRVGHPRVSASRTSRRQSMGSSSRRQLNSVYGRSRAS
jgi:hypothetical protein